MDREGSYWWMNETIPESFSMAALDQTYNANYFANGGHPVHARDTYVDYVFRLCSLFMPQQQKITSVIEFGNGGGYFAKVFSNRLTSGTIYQPGHHPLFTTVEGTGAGIAETLQKWQVPEHQVIQHDLRLPIFVGHRYDVAVCTEVVEHLEPPFASQIILTLVLHSDVIWFSFKPYGGNHRAWINHPNERPLKFWKNLFDFYDYNIVGIPTSMHKDIAWRGSFIAYRRGNHTLTSNVKSEDFIRAVQA
jgi:hypothetical protein